MGDDLQVFERKIVRHCSPVLVGVKPANLFTFRVESNSACPCLAYRRGQAALTPGGFERGLAACRAKLDPFGIRLALLAERCTGQLVYAFRPALLAAMLARPAERRFLEARGYDVGSLPECIALLAERIASSTCGKTACPQGRACGFPHEIGLFLGYPLDDVVGFIENQGKNYLACGCWKVYSRASVAKRRFACYRTCTLCCERAFEQGSSLEQLLVRAEDANDALLPIAARRLRQRLAREGAAHCMHCTFPCDALPSAQRIEQAG